MGIQVKSCSTKEELKKEMAHNLDLSGMSLDSLPNPPINLSIITKLDLSNNNLESIPESLTARLLNVAVLDVRSNQLKSLPNSIGCLSKLKVLNELNVNFNKLAKLPDTIGFELTNLKRLSVNSNKLAFLPYSTSHMTSLKHLDARLNSLRSLPDGLENLIRLETLNVSQNFQFLSSIPYSVGLLISLTELDISYNRIGVLPESIGCLTKLRKFRAEGNPLVSPPMEVVQEGADAVREYLSVKMSTANSIGAKKKKTWVGKLAKLGTFSSSRMHSRSIREKDEHDGLMMPDYRPIEGLATPTRYLGRLFSPRRLFSPSPRRDSSRK
ncbi:Plant intracellular Ras-group-related LRR protein 1 [Ananas comosus]|uniref:Plant intracellular Ras-group-related LRR protein 1 n=1 Tax=Ananas comosus TaxID=4615 RepID=A0A199VC99_ANACO|nr:Plant intracellular Ras-group-related LRR protein 1 [Ananas comosus]